MSALLSFAQLIGSDDSTADTATDTDAVFVLPESFDELDDGALADLEAEATAAFDAVRDSDLTGESLATLEALATAVEEIRNETTARFDAAAEAAARAEALTSRIHGEPVAETPEAVASEEVSTEANVQSDPMTGDVLLDEDGNPVVDETGAAEVVTAAAPRRRVVVPLGAIRRNAPEPVVPDGDRTGVVITAAADLPGRSPGSRFGSVEEIAVAMHQRARHLGDKASAPIASIARSARFVIEKQADFSETSSVLASARTIPGDGSAASLIASGGWCAPSETLYDQFSIEGTDGILDVPTVTIKRGGIEFVTNGGPSIADVFGDSNIWLWTEENDQDAGAGGGQTKPCAAIPCPSFEEVRLDAHGICLTHGNLSDQAFPENTARFVDLTIAAHVHTMNGRHLAAIAAACDDVTIAALNPGTAAPLLNAIDLQVADYRDKFRMNESSVLELVVPTWIKGMIRSDLAWRAGVDLLAVSDADVSRYLAARSVRPQFVYDWQALQTGTGQSEIQTLALGSASAGTFTIEFQGQTTAAIAYNASAATVQTALLALSNLNTGDVVVTGGALPTLITLTFGGNYAGLAVDPITIADAGANLTGETITIATTQQGGAALGTGDGFREAWPTNVEFLLYAAGTFVKGLGGSLDLLVGRDSTLNATNDHTVAFTEEFQLIAKMGHEGRKVSVTGVQADGQVGPQPTS